MSKIHNDTLKAPLDIDISEVQVKYCSKKQCFYFVKKRTLCNPFKTKFKYYTWDRMSALLEENGYKIDNRLYLTPSLKRDTVLQPDISGAIVEECSTNADIDNTKNKTKPDQVSEIEKKPKTHRFWGKGETWS
jgi:hypothetical protein